MNQVAASEAWQNGNGRYRLLIDAITDYAIYMLDPEGLVTSWNPGAQRFKGYTAEEIIGRHFSLFYTDEERDAGLPALALSTATREGRFEREAWRVRKDGTRFWAHVVIDPVREPSGKLVGFAKITRDLTDRKEAEQALQQSDAQFRLLVQGVSDYAIYMLDPEGRVTNWNVGAQRIKGYTPDEVVGAHFSKFYTPEDRAKAVPDRSLATAAREGRWEQEGWRVRKDGSRFWAHAVIDAIHDDSGALIGFAKVTRDVTERLAAQEALDQAQQALLQSQKLDAIGQLTGGVAHDFNNLLTAVLGSLDLVKKRLPYDPRVTPLIDNAIQGAQRGAALTQRMLAFARKQELQITRVDLFGLVKDLQSLLQRTIGPAVRVDVDVPRGLPPVSTDHNQVENALINLVVNARDAMPRGGRAVISADIRMAGGEGDIPPGEYIALSVCDSGEGMDPDTLRRATEPFFTTKGIGKGTGLGLSMAHGLAAQSGGGLKLKSLKGQGTTVELWLPLWHGQEDEDGEPVDVRDGGACAKESQSLVILAVDDDSLVLMNTAAMLEDLGHEVVQAESGREALGYIGERPGIQLVITDQAMPVMTGIELAERIRRLRPELPVIIATGYAELQPGTHSDLPRLPKPFTQSALAIAIGEVAGIPN